MVAENYHFKIKNLPVVPLRKQMMRGKFRYYSCMNGKNFWVLYSTLTEDIQWHIQEAQWSLYSSCHVTEQAKRAPLPFSCTYQIGPWAHFAGTRTSYFEISNAIRKLNTQQTKKCCCSGAFSWIKLTSRLHLSDGWKLRSKQTLQSTGLAVTRLSGAHFCFRSQ